MPYIDWLLPCQEKVKEFPPFLNECDDLEDIDAFAGVDFGQRYAVAALLKPAHVSGILLIDNNNNRLALKL